MADQPAAYVLERSRKGKGRLVRQKLAAVRAAEAVGTLSPGCEVFGLTKGQFSLIDLIEHGLNTTGPADVLIAAWTVGGADLELAWRFLSDGRIRSLRFIVDHSFVKLQPHYCAALRERFGDDAIRLTTNHAKFVVVHNETWHLAIRSSMNLNENSRLETWEISDDQALADYLLEVCESLFENYDSAAQWTRARHGQTTDFDSWFGNEARARDLRRAGWPSQKPGKRVG